MPVVPDSMDVGELRTVVNAAAECNAAREQLHVRLRRAEHAIAASKRRRTAPPVVAGPTTTEADGDRRSGTAQRDFEAELIAEHLGLARHLAARYYRRGEAADDLEQVAMLALVRAARRYDPTRGIPFSGYATPSILGEIKRYFRDRSWSMRVPRPLKELYLQAKAARDEIVNETGVAPTVPELAERLHCSVEEVLEAMEAGQNFHPASIEGLDEVRARQLPSSDGGFEGVLDRHRLAELLPRLSPEERRIIEMRFVEERTQASIAGELGVSQMHISRTLDRILTKLRQGMEGT